MMTANSMVSSLSLNNGGTVSFGDQSIPVTSNNAMTLTTDKLTGNGNLFMRTNVIGTGNGAGNVGDLLVINQSSAGSHQLHFNDSSTGGLNVDGTEKLKVVQDTVSGADKAVFNSTGVDYGAYVFKLKKDGTDWYLVATDNTPPVPPTPPDPDPTPVPDPTPNPQPTPDPDPAPTPTNPADHSANILNVNYLLGYVETQTLLQRMGELRQAQGSEGNGWARVYGGHLTSFENQLSGFKMNYGGVQIGADKRFIQGKDNIYAGVMAGTARANPDYDNGSGDTTSYHLGIYGTYMAERGFYADAILKYTWMQNSFNTTTSSGYAVNGDGDTSGISASIEVGQRFYPQDKGFYIEPQAQLTYGHQSSATINSSNGLVTTLSGYDSLIGRVSAILGYSLKDSANPIDIYFKTGYVREFNGDTGFTFNDGTINDYSFKGGWWDNAIGINGQFNKVHNVYVDVNYAVGSRFNQLQGNVGYRYQF